MNMSIIIRDLFLPELILEPVDNSYYGVTGYANGQIRIAFIRSNIALETMGGTQIDGHRLSGGVVLMSGENLRDNWLKVRLIKIISYFIHQSIMVLNLWQSTFQESFFGDDFHTYTLTWTDQRILLGVDNNNYAILNGNFQTATSNVKIPHQESWKRGNTMAPFDREFYISLGVGAGGISDFPDKSKTGDAKIEKPWENTSPKGEYHFWSSKDKWHQTWNSQESGLIVDYVKVWSI